MNVSSLQSFEDKPLKKGIGWGKEHYWLWHGIKCHWRILGEGNQGGSIVFIHGFGASSGHWRNNANFFASKGYEVYALDLIGFGQTDQPSRKVLKVLDNKIWSKQLNDFLLEIVKINKDNKVILIGNSLGSLVALTTYYLRSDLISALIASPLPDPAFMQNLINIKNKYLINIINKITSLFFKLLPLEILIPLISKTFLIKLALQGAYKKSILRDYELLRLIKKPALRASSAMALRAMCIGMATREISITAPFILRNIDKFEYKIPFLLLWGEEDRFVPILIAKQIVKSYDWIELLTLENTGHCPHDESPDDFNNFVLKWLDINLVNNKEK